jgi:hypothetical protein
MKSDGAACKVSLRSTARPPRLGAVTSMLGRRPRHVGVCRNLAWYPGQAMPSAAPRGMRDDERLAKSQFTIGMAPGSCKARKVLALRICLRREPERQPRRAATDVPGRASERGRAIPAIRSPHAPPFARLSGPRNRLRIARIPDQVDPYNDICPLFTTQTGCYRIAFGNRRRIGARTTTLSHEAADRVRNCGDDPQGSYGPNGGRRG